MATTLDKSEVTEYREMFEMFDRNGDGVISTQEVKTVLKTLGLDPSAETVTDLIEEFDDNGNGVLDLDEFLALMVQIRKQAEEEEEDAVEVFKQLDADHDGIITQSDVRQMSKKVGLNFSAIELEEMMEEADKNKTGHVDFEEFLRVVTGR